LAIFISPSTILFPFSYYKIFLFFFQNHDFNFFIFLLIIKKIQNYRIFKVINTIYFMRNIGYCLKHKKSSQDFMLQMQLLHSFILIFLLLNIFHHNGKTMVEGIAYIGPIMM